MCALVLCVCVSKPSALLPWGWLTVKHRQHMDLARNLRREIINRSRFLPSGSTLSSPAPFHSNLTKQQPFHVRFPGTSAESTGGVLSFYLFLWLFFPSSSTPSTTLDFVNLLLGFSSPPCCSSSSSSNKNNNSQARAADWASQVQTSSPRAWCSLDHVESCWSVEQKMLRRSFKDSVGE